MFGTVGVEEGEEGTSTGVFGNAGVEEGEGEGGASTGVFGTAGGEGREEGGLVQGCSVLQGRGGGERVISAGVISTGVCASAKQAVKPVYVDSGTN